MTESLTDRLERGEVTVVRLAAVRYLEQSGARPSGYVREYVAAAERVDEEHDLVWITREEQDRLIDAYREEDTPGRRRQARQAMRRLREAIKRGREPGETMGQAYRRLRSTEEIRGLWEQVPRLAPDTGPGLGSGAAARRGLVRQEIADTPETQRAERVLEKVRSKTLTAEEAIEIKRKMGIQ